MTPRNPELREAARRLIKLLGYELAREVYLEVHSLETRQSRVRKQAGQSDGRQAAWMAAQVKHYADELAPQPLPPVPPGVGLGD